MSEEFRALTQAVEVMVVEPGGPAEGAGLRTGDLITAINDQAIKSIDDLHRVLASWPPQPVTLKVIRDLDRLLVRLLPTETPSP